MLTDKEKAFLVYWEGAREEEAQMSRKLRRGLPLSMAFGLPILFSVILVYYLSPEWYTKISRSVNQVTITVFIAVLIFMVVFSFVYMHFKWEMNEQAYLELREKQRREEAAK